MFPPRPPLRQPPSATSSCWLDWLAALAVQRFLIAKGWKKKRESSSGNYTLKWRRAVKSHFCLTFIRSNKKGEEKKEGQDAQDPLK